MDLDLAGRGSGEFNFPGCEERGKGRRTAAFLTFAILCYATPVFFLGMLLKLVFSIWLGWLPVAGRASTGAEIQLRPWPTRPASTP